MGFDTEYTIAELNSRLEEISDLIENLEDERTQLLNVLEELEDYEHE
jgi:hypothetical protein